MHPRLLFSLLAAVAVAAFAAALIAGSVPVGITELWGALQGAEGTAATVVRELRLPRALAAFAVGAMLALSGALLQVLLGNPLADPYVLGVSGGAAAGALGTMLIGLAGVATPIGALAGALLSTALLFGLVGGSARQPTQLLLTGVVLAAGWGALVSFMLAIAPDTSLRGMLFWLMGDLSGTRVYWPAYAVLALALLVVLPAGRSLNLLARGDIQAAALGVETARLRLTLYFTASLLTAVAVTLGGSIGFVGLVIPHLLRLAGLTDHRLLLPAAVLAGGALLLIADTLARTTFAPQQLPVGVLTAFLGVPLFLYLLRRSTRR